MHALFLVQCCFRLHGPEGVEASSLPIACEFILHFDARPGGWRRWFDVSGVIYAKSLSATGKCVGGL